MTMKKYVTYTVQIPVEEGGELHERIEAMAKNRNMLPEDAVSTVVQLGIYGHMESNLALYEQSPGR